MIPRIPRLRWPTPRELLGGLVVSALFGIGVCAGTQIGGPVAVQTINGPVRIDTVTIKVIEKAEPPAQPSLPHRLAYKDVQPTKMSVAPGAGRELLAAVCDTTAIRAVNTAGEHPAQPGPDSGQVAQPRAAPALAYAEKISQPWTPWGRVTLRRFAVGPDGQTMTETKVHLPAEWRTSPEPVVREARGWRRALKPLPFVAGVFAAGWVAHSIATQF